MYIKDRVDGQIEWYDRKSAMNNGGSGGSGSLRSSRQHRSHCFVGYADSISEFKVVVGILGLLIAVIAGVLELYQFQENWTGYRTTCEALKQEKYLFLTKTQPYDQGDSFALFVQRVENFISKNIQPGRQYIGAGAKPKDQP